MPPVPGLAHSPSGSAAACTGNGALRIGAAPGKRTYIHPPIGDARRANGINVCAAGSATNRASSASALSSPNGSCRTNAGFHAGAASERCRRRGGVWPSRVREFFRRRGLREPSA